MSDADCVRFLRDALPRLGLSWPGFRKVRGQVCKRIRRRMAALGVAGFDGYRRRLADRGEEWAVLDSLCRISVSRFWRDAPVFDHLRAGLLPRLAAEAASRTPPRVRAWSAGAASGEECYSLALAWRLGPAARAGRALPEIVATDADHGLIARALGACYPRGSLKELPAELRRAAFVRENQDYCLRARFRVGIRFALQDIRAALPPGPFDLVLCRNLAFTYFDPASQARVLAAIAARLRPGGRLVIGRGEQLPEAQTLFAADPGGLPIYHRRPEAEGHR
jgi:chemotaxis protein methyltransferase CheR